MIAALGVFAAAALISYFIAGRVKRHAVLDYPTDRGLHDVPTPRGGGVGIAVVALLAWIIGLILYGGPWRAGLGLPLRATLNAARGTIPDMETLARLARVAGPVAAAGIPI